ncbi:MAG: AraC family transcriptional regulator [Planctomycetota bacterium]
MRGETRQYTEDQRALRHRGITQLGWSRSTSADDYGLAAHRHANSFELCLIVSGQVDWWAEDETHLLGPGMCHLTRPGEVHGGANDVLGLAELYWVGFTLPEPPRAYGVTPTEAQRLAERLHGLPRTFRGDAALEACLAQLMASCRSSHPLASLRTRATMLNMLLAAIDCADRANDERTAISPGIAAAIRAFRRKPSRVMSVDELADVAGLSVSRFHERFVQETGYAPADWCARQRIAHAKRMLRESDKTVTIIAMDCGFASSQYFATAFRKIVGITPTAYRRAGH